MLPSVLKRRLIYSFLNWLIMKRILYIIVIFTLIGTTCRANMKMFEYMPTPEEMVDSIEAKFGIKITPPLGYVLTTGEWLSLSSQRGGINHISPINGVI